MEKDGLNALYYSSILDVENPDESHFDSKLKIAKLLISAKASLQNVQPKWRKKTNKTQLFFVI